MMDNLLTFFFFLLGTILGSFYNVVGLRLPKGENFLTGRSYCPGCKRSLRWYELIPVISFLLQRRVCRRCEAKISALYPLIELGTGVLFAFSFYKLGFSVELFMAFSFFSMLMILFVTDITYLLIPNKVLLFFLPIFILLRLINPLDPWWSPLTGALTGFGLIAFIILLSKGGMGAGDMKLFGVLGFILGFKKVLLTLFLASLIGTIVGGFQRLMKHLKKGEPIPFGPSIGIAAIITYFYGDLFIELYLQLF